MPPSGDLDWNPGMCPGWAEGFFFKEREGNRTKRSREVVAKFSMQMSTVHPDKASDGASSWFSHYGFTSSRLHA